MFQISTLLSATLKFNLTLSSRDCNCFASSVNLDCSFREPVDTFLSGHHGGESTSFLDACVDLPLNQF